MTKYSKISNYFVVIVFLIMISTPHILFLFLGSYISVESNENRELAKKPEFSVENIENYSIGYERYYNDNLPFRNLIKAVWANLNFLILNESTDEQIVIGKNEGSKSSTWLFYQKGYDGDPVVEAQGRIEFSEKDKNEIYSQIKTTTEEIKKRGIKTYYAIVPNKESLYKEKLPNRVKIHDEKTRVDKAVDYLQNERGLQNVIYVKNALVDEKKNAQLYDKQDSHWNDYGAFIGFKEILNNIEPGYTNFEHNVKFSNEEIVYKDLTKMLGVKRIMKDTIPTVEFLPEKQYMTQIIETPTNSIVITTCDKAEIDETLLVIGDSFRVGMIPYFSKIYKKVIYTHRCDYGIYMLNDHKPDVVILEYVERYVKDIGDFAMYK